MQIWKCYLIFTHRRRHFKAGQGTILNSFQTRKTDEKAGTQPLMGHTIKPEKWQKKWVCKKSDIGHQNTGIRCWCVLPGSVILALPGAGADLAGPGRLRVSGVGAIIVVIGKSV